MKTSTLHLTTFKLHPIVSLLVSVLLGLVLVALVSMTLPVNPADPELMGNDWVNSLRPASLATVTLRNPYNLGAFNPPWIFALLAPAAILPANLSAAVMFVAALFGFLVAGMRWKAKPVSLILFVLSPPVIAMAWLGNIDWLVALGATLSPQIGLFLVLAKPQVGIGLAVFWLFEAWQRGRLREVVRVFAPVSLAMLLSFALYGLWPLSAAHVVGASWSVSFFPYSLPIGAALLVYAIKHHRPEWALFSSPFFAPYLGLPSWAIVAFAVLPLGAEGLAAIAASWLAWNWYIPHLVSVIFSHRLN